MNLLPDDIALFQYYKGVMFGVLAGLTLGWLIWRLPVYLKTRHTKQLRKVVMDLHRIEAAFVGQSLPNPRELRVQRVPLRDRIQEWWQVTRAEWRAALTPRTPEQVARLAYERELAGVL